MSVDLQKLLAPLRKRESKEHLCAVVDDHDAIRLLDAFANAETAWKPRRGARVPKDPDALWGWLWGFVLLDLQAIAASAKLSQKTAATLLRVCIAARLVYPDGTITKPARTLIADYVRSRYPGRATGRPKGSKTKKAKVNK